jgi:hypothetical protein
MSVEIPDRDITPESEGGNWEYCVLSWNPYNEDNIMRYEVNKRRKMSVQGRGAIQNEMREMKKMKREPERDPLNSYYEDKFMERWRETGGFGPFDAIDVLTKDSWEVVTSVAYIEDVYNRLFIIFKRQKGQNSPPESS